MNFYSKYSEQYDDTIGALTQYNQSYVDFVAKAMYTRTLLDIASGPANVSCFIKTLLPVIAITCVDLSETMLDRAKSKLGDGMFYKSDMLNIQIPIHRYDLIVCAFGLPYIESSQLEQFVSQIEPYTHSESIVYISCMQGNTSALDTMGFANGEKIIVHRHSKQAVTDSFKFFGFEVIDYKEQDYIEPDGSVTIDMIFNVKKV